MGFLILVLAAVPGLQEALPEYVPLRQKERIVFEPKISFWRPAIGGRVAPDVVRGAEGVYPEGSRASFDGDLGFDPRETASLFEFELFGRGGNPDSALNFGGLRLTVWRHSWHERNELPRDLEVDGEVFSAGSPVSHTLRVQYIGGDFVLGGVALPESAFGMEVALGARYFGFEYEMTGPGGGLDDAEGGLGFHMGFGLGFRPHPWCYAAGRVGWAGLLGVPNSEASASAGIDLGFLRLEGGYRGIWAHSNNNGQFLDLELAGPFLSFEIRF